MSAADAAAAIARDTNTAASEAVWKGPMPDERLARMEEQARDAFGVADACAEMAQASDRIAHEADQAAAAIADLGDDWDEAGSGFARLAVAAAAEEVRQQFDSNTARARAVLADRASSLQPVIDRGDPLDFLFGPIQVPGGPYLGEQLDDDAANEYFETGHLIDPEHVSEIKDAFTGLPDGEQPPEDWNAWARENGYRPEEVAAALDELDAAERAALDQWLADNKGDLENDATYPNSPAQGLTSFLWQNMRADQIDEFHNDIPNLEPTLWGDANGWVDGEVEMGVDFDITDGGSGIAQIDQGSLGDCATLASLAAAVAADPTFVDRHITENANGTYTVKLYDENGMPVYVTVSGHIPADNGNPIYNGRGLDGEINWASIYEKAMAQYQGGHYEGIDGAYTPDRLNTTVGNGNERTDLPADGVFGEMQEAFENGQPVIMGGGGHAYAVVGFEDGRVLVMNPWGGDGSVIALTEEQFNSGEFPPPGDRWPDFTYVAVT
ncbi:C2 family cysteine protease [Phytoactinopolyspora limicola]|uniref:C2 family cysteine protease n=1 Tax=Phytoactinopolyspora limicola TaxID=2715536 RepID=UPI00140CC3F2|nr:C2 family cysteine protease [Phytoactinopolyspora limicola]